MKTIQFSTRYMLAVLAVIAVMLSCLGHKMRKHRDAQRMIDEVRAAGGTVVYDYQMTPDHFFIDEAANPPGPACLRRVFGESYSAQVVGLRVQSCATLQADVIDFFARVVFLDLSESDVTDADLCRLKPLRDLEFLNLAYTDIGNRSAPWIGGQVSLRHLSLAGTAFSDVSALSSLLCLESIDLSDTLVADVKPLSELASLSSLDLSDTRVEAIDSLLGLRSLMSVSLSGTSIRSIDVARHWKSLRVLDLCGTPVEDFKPLQGIRTLEELDVIDTHCNVGEIRRWLPGCYVAH